MERLNRHEAYKSGRCSKLLLELNNNYRSNAHIIDLQSQIFYNSSLCARADSTIVNSLQNWHMLPNRGTPWMFVDVEGKDQRERDSPSWYNINELMAIADLVSDLHRTNEVEQSQIAVVSSYKLQQIKLRKLLRARDLRDVDVGPPESLQGKDKRAVFVSFVRTSEQALHDDTHSDVGLHHNAGRLNSVMTRAQALLVLVGNAELLSRAELGLTSQILRAAKASGCYTDLAFLSEQRKPLHPSACVGSPAPTCVQRTPQIPVEPAYLLPQPMRMTSAPNEWVPLDDGRVVWLHGTAAPALKITSSAIDISLFGLKPSIDHPATDQIYVLLQPDFSDAIFTSVPGDPTELLIVAPPGHSIRLEKIDSLLMRVALQSTQSTQPAAQPCAASPASVWPAPSMSEASRAAQPWDASAASVWSASGVQSVCSSLGSSKLWVPPAERVELQSRLVTPTSQCWYGYYCHKGTQCGHHHTADQKEFFQKVGNGACPKAYKMKLCQMQNCRYAKMKAWCTYAHGESDFWCTCCGKSGHTFVQCPQRW
jgi:hypothetical protein